MSNVADLKAKVIAQQARIEQLLDAVNNLEGALDESWLYRDYPITYAALLEALSTPDDLSALREHDEAIVKQAGEVMRERCRFSASSNDFYVFSETIRALPAVTLDDLK